MNKKGFIATSLILTFFLLFCAILLGVISNYNFNTNLLDKLKENLNSDVNGDTNDNGNRLEIDEIDTGSDIIIAAEIYKLKGDDYVLDENMKTFPTFATDERANQYKASVKCTGLEGDSDAVASLIWNWTTSRWELNLTRVSQGGIECTAKFEEFRYPSPTGWYEAADGTLLAELRKNNPVYPPVGDTTYEPPETLASQERSIPGKGVAINEALMSFTEDDYGWSYYFRGDIDSVNNYVIFAGNCWKILRVLGNGAIKLVINNTGESCSSIANYNSFLKSGDNFSFSSASNNYYYISSNSYTAAKSWYMTNIINKTKNYNSQIYDAIWCNDGSGSAYSRISSGKPTLICRSYSSSNPNYYKFTANDTTYGNGLLKEQIGVTEGDGYYEYKIGLLTADEVAFAGYTFSASCVNCFLRLNDTYTMASMTRYDSSTNTTMVGYSSFSVDSTGNRMKSVGSNTLINHRQAIALNPDVLLSNTDAQLNNTTNPIGSFTNPYKIADPS